MEWMTNLTLRSKTFYSLILTCLNELNLWKRESLQYISSSSVNTDY
jgi:hypothetical protein